MKKLILVSIAAFLIAVSCGEPAAVVEEVSEGVVTDTLTAVDSIGVLMGDSNQVLGMIADFTMLPGGRPAILDRVKGTVSVFDAQGEFLFDFGGFGEGPGEFQFAPFHLARLNSGMFVVTELMGNATAYDSTGAYLGKWQFPGMGGLPLDCIAFDDSSFVCYYFGMSITDGAQVNYSLKRYHAVTGEILTTYFDWMEEPAADTDFTPAYLAAASDGNGTLFVTLFEDERWRIDVYEDSPVPIDSLMLFPERERIALPDSGGMVPGVLSVRYAFSDDSDNMEQKTVNMPGAHPFISQLGVDCHGNIWCRRGGFPGEVWDVVSRSGEHLSETAVTLPDSAGFIMMDVNSHGILGFDILTEDYHKLYILE